MIQGKWGNYQLDDTAKPVLQQPALPRNLGPEFSAIQGPQYYRDKKIPSQSFVGDNVAQSALAQNQQQQLVPISKQEELSRFSNGKQATPSAGLDMFGKMPGNAIIRDAKTGKVLAKSSGEATGGFSRPSTWKENLAFEDAQHEQMRNISDRRRALDTQDLQESLMHRASTGDKNALETLKSSGHIRPNDFAQQQFHQAQAAALPIATRSHTALEGAQADYYSGRNSTDRGNSMYENYVKALVAGNKSSKALSATDWKALADLQMTNPEMYAKAMEYLKVQG